MKKEEELKEWEDFIFSNKTNSFKQKYSSTSFDGMQRKMLQIVAKFAYKDTNQYWKKSNHLRDWER